ncbi:DUF5376 family protein [Psychrobacter sp. NPDC078631]|uniref:DUF5376 family protein n=1 Tax=Psychrobacter sp. NPDC078631 TaxID=3390666 RepID=UPI003D05B71D
MSMAFYYFKNDEWDRPIPSCRPLNNSNEMRMMSYYLSELDIEFSENILHNLRNNNINILDISSETWQVVIDGKNVTICSIYDEDNNDFKATVKKDVFEKFIVAWLDFLRQDYSLEIIIDL